MNPPLFVLKTASAKMPSSVKAPYRRIGILLMNEGYTHALGISDRYKGVKRVVYQSTALHAGGLGPGTAYARELRFAERLCELLNKAQLAWMAAENDNTTNELIRELSQQARST
jgi:hypothetical protein